MKPITLMAGVALLAVCSCEPNRENNRNETSDAERALSDAKESVENVFTRTYEDLREDKEEVREDLNELKAEKPERAQTNTQGFDRRVAEIESLLQEMDNRADAFRNATEERQDKIKDEFDSLKNQAQEKIREVKNEYKKSN
jgi:archaellum component FlaC